MLTKSASKQLTISIVSFNTRSLLKRCLSSIYKFTQNLSFEVIVVDNASTDGSAAMVKKYFPQVKLIANSANNFYTGANNQALAIGQGEYFLILNSDIFFKDNALAKMVQYLKQHSLVGAVEPAQLYEDGRIVGTGSKHDSLWHSLTELTLLHKIFKPKSLQQYRMTNKDRTQVWPAPVICDAALMARTDQLKHLGGYDEKFKLYYTENDLCHRLQALGLSTVHYGLASVYHRVSASTDKAGWQTISPLYNRDAFAYYRKYHSLIQGVIIYLGMALNNWRLVLILALALFLRLYRLPELMTFIPDQGRDYLAARDMLLIGQPVLVGIPSSVPWLRQGPFFIWLIALALKLGNFHPVAPAIMTAVFGTLSVYLVYRFSRSRLAAFVMATAPLAVVHSRLAYHTSPIPLFTILYLIALKQKSLGWSFFLAAVLLQFELTTLPLTFLSILVFRSFSIFWFIPFVPKLIYDLTHGFTQTLGFAAWAGYRLVNVFHYGNALPAIWEFWIKFTAWGYPLLAVLIGFIFFYSLPRQSKLLLAVLGLTLLSFFIHGAPSEAYFPVLFVVWAITLGTVKSKFLQSLIILICVFNVYSLLAHNFYPYGPTITEQINSLDQPGQDNYQYLLWYRQNYDQIN
ncbi:MAG: glycosyltransferase [Patescibacteria group bacterium]